MIVNITSLQKEVKRKDLENEVYQHLDKCVSQQTEVTAKTPSADCSSSSLQSILVDTAEDILTICESLSDQRKVCNTSRVHHELAINHC